MTHVVLLPAFPLDTRVWKAVALGLAAVGHEVEVLDFPGLGSGPPLLDGEPGLHQAAEYVRARVRDGSVLGGVSMGGYVVMEVLRLLEGVDGAPRLGGIVLADTKSTADAESGRAGRMAMADAVEREPGRTSDLLHAGLLDAVLGNTPDPHVRDLVGQWLDDAPPLAVAYYQRAMAARPDSRRDLAGFTGPALVIWGEEDRLSPRAEQELTSAALACPSLVVIARAGHLACVEQPEAFTREMLAWLESIG